MNHILRKTLFVLAATCLTSTLASAQLKVVTSTTDLYDIARSVGGSLVTATHIGQGYEDPHFVQPKPSFILRLREADVWAYVGLDLEIGWMPLLLDGARNSKIRAGAPGHINASTVVPVLDANRADVDDHRLTRGAARIDVELEELGARQISAGCRDGGSHRAPASPAHRTILLTQ